MLRFDQATGRIIQRVVGLQGMNTLQPRRDLQEGESTNALNVRVRSKKVVPGKESTGVEAFPSFAPAENIQLMFEAVFSTPRLVLLGLSKAYTQASGKPVVKTPAAPFTGGATALWHGYTIMSRDYPVVVVNNSGVDLPHYFDPAHRTLSYDVGDKGTGDEPDVGDTVTGASGSVGTILSFTTATGTWAGGDATGVLTLESCSGDWADDEVLTFEDGETAAADGASAERVFVPLTNAPNARCIIGWLGRLFLGDVQPGNVWLNNQIIFSKNGDITDYSDATYGTYDLKDEGDPIKRFARFRGNYMAVLRTNSIYNLFPTGDPGDPISDQPFATRGILAPNSLQMLEQEYLFLGQDDVYLLSTKGLDRVGGRIRTDLFRDADESNLQYAWSFMDKRTKEYYLVTDMQDGTKRCWIFNYEDNTWASQTLTGYTCVARWREDT